MKVLAIIPARSGSQKLPNKNIRELAGKPMLAYTIEAAKDSGIFAEIHVSTDSEQYALIAKSYGARIPFLRTPELAQSHSTGNNVVAWVLQEYAEKGEQFDAFMVLQPTSPLRTAEDICASYTMYQERNARAVISVCEAEHSPLWANTLGENGSLEGFIQPSTVNKNRQDNPIYYRLNGAIYLSSKEFFLEEHNFYRKGSYAYIMPPERSVDVDSLLDFEFAEFLLEREG